MDIVILRHGEAGNRMDVASRDVERSLTEAGKKEVGEVAEALSALKTGIDLVVTSPLKRARETANIAAKVLKKQDHLEVWDELKPEADTQALFRRLAKLKQDASVLVVGHEPFLSSMIGELISGTRSSRIVLKKAGVARVDVSAFLPRPTGELRWLMTPRQLKRLA